MLPFPLFCQTSVMKCISMMTWSNGNIFHVTGPLWGEPQVTDGFPSQRPLTRNSYVFFDVRLNKWLRKQSRRLWFEMLSCSLWLHCNGMSSYSYYGNVHVLYADLCTAIALHFWKKKTHLFFTVYHKIPRKWLIYTWVYSSFLHCVLSSFWIFISTYP